MIGTGRNYYQDHFKTKIQDFLVTGTILKIRFVIFQKEISGGCNEKKDSCYGWWRFHRKSFV